MLSLLKRKPKPQLQIEHKAPEPVRRNRQQNIKVSEDCATAFSALAEAQGMSKSAMFEDMLAERLETLRQHGFELGLLNR